MEYPKELKFKVNNIFGPEDITIFVFWVNDFCWCKWFW